MPDVSEKNALSHPIDNAVGYVRDWWNGLGDDMRSQAGLPQSELLRRFGVAALMAPMALRAMEMPGYAALKLGDQTFTGRQHFEALNKAMDVLGPETAESLITPNAGGFITNWGRYVDRIEAAKMLGAKRGSELHASEKPGAFISLRRSTGDRELLER